MPAPEIVVYTKDWCRFCIAAKVWLTLRRLPFTVVNLTGDAAGREALAARTGRKTVPQIFINGVGVGGYTDLRALAARGELDALLAGDAAPR